MRGHGDTPTISTQKWLTVYANICHGPVLSGFVHTCSDAMAGRGHNRQRQANKLHSHFNKNT
jgi:hypothetical protein